MRKFTLSIVCLPLLLSLAGISGLAQAEPGKSQADSPQKNKVGKLPSKAIDINSATEKQLSSLPGIGTANGQADHRGPAVQVDSGAEAGERHR